MLPTIRFGMIRNIIQPYVCSAPENRLKLHLYSLTNLGACLVFVFMDTFSNNECSLLKFLCANFLHNLILLWYNVCVDNFLQANS